MNKLLLHGITAAAAAGLGWLAGAPASDAARQLTNRQDPATAAGERPPAGAGWERQLASVRRVPGAQGEPAWIKWCFTIPDADLPAAIAKLNPHADFHALRCLYARWARLDPEAAWASFRKSAIPEHVLHFHLPESDEASAGGLAWGRLSSSARSLIAARMLVSMESKDPAAAKALAARLRAPRSEDARDVPVRGDLSTEVDRLLGRTTRDGDPAIAPAEAAAAAMEMADDKARQAALGGAVRRWLRSDPAAACAWLRQLPPADLKQLDFHQVAWELGQATPADRARTLCAFLEPRELGLEVIETAILAGHAWAGGDRDGVTSASVAVFAWAREDPTAAREWLTTLPEGSLKASMAGTIAGALARTDVNAAIGLLNDTGGDQGLAVGALMHGWIQSDARAALEWAGKLEDVPLRDTSRSTAALQLAGTEPVLAIETALTITDVQRQRSVFDAVERALSWNPAAFRALREQYPDVWVAVIPPE